jgi:hypothetical protein
MVDDGDDDDDWVDVTTSEDSASEAAA